MPIKRVSWDSEQVEKLDDLVRNSFSEFVRKERRNLLISSSVAMIACVGKVTTNEVSALGMKFTSLTPSVVYQALAGICTYSLLSFWLYALPEYRSARKTWDEDRQTKPLKTNGDTAQVGMTRENFFTIYRYSVWLSFEYVFPVLYGAISILLCIYRICSSA
jgi:hypothetical protein